MLKLSVPLHHVSHKGQSLFELVLVMIVLVPIMVGVGYAGMAMYQGTMASEAIKEPATTKNELAGRSGAISQGELLAQTRRVGGNFLGNTAALDSVRITDPGVGDIALLVGHKQSITIPIFNLSFDFGVVQPIQKNLLEANTGTRSSGPNEAPANLAGKKGPPSENPKFQKDNLPPLMECSPPSASTTVTPAVANALYPDAPGATYDSREEFSIPVKLGLDSVMKFMNSADVASECQDLLGGGTCAKEMADLQPKPATNKFGCPDDKGVPQCVYATYHENPKGAPGQRLEIRYDAKTGQETKTFTPMFGPPQGLYYDASGAYEKPPGDFMQSCTQRKVAECKIKAAAKKANELAEEYADACQD